MPVTSRQARPRRAERRQIASLPLPNEQDAAVSATAAAPDPVIAQAKRDLDAGQVDTDLRATAGLDADLRARLVPGPGGKPPGSGR